MKRRNKTEIFEFDELKIKKTSEFIDENSDKAVSSFELIIKGIRMPLDFEGPLNVLPLEKGIYLIRGRDRHILLRNINNAVAVDHYRIENAIKYADYIDDNTGITYHKAFTELESYPYKVSMKMLELGLIVLRIGNKYNLVNFRTGKILISGFDNIEEINGSIVVEKVIYTTETYTGEKDVNIFTYPSDVLVGTLNTNLEIENGQLISQKYGIPVSLADKNADLETMYDFLTTDLKNDFTYTFDYSTYRLEKEGVGRK